MAWIVRYDGPPFSKTADHFEAAQPFIKNLSNSQVWITIAIVNYNSGDWLRRCVQALSNQINQNFRVVIVDNASTDGSLELIPELDERFSLLRFKEDDIGFAAANNLVCLNATTLWVATLNPDALPLVIGSVKCCQPQSAIGTWPCSDLPKSVKAIVGCLTASEPSFLGLPWRGNYNHSLAEIPEEGYVFSPCAAAAVYRSDAFKQAGGFDERFFCYCEDVDLGFRLRLLGYECVRWLTQRFITGARQAPGREAISPYLPQLSQSPLDVREECAFSTYGCASDSTFDGSGILLVREIVVGKKFKPAWAGLSDGIRNIWKPYGLFGVIGHAEVFSVVYRTCNELVALKNGAP